MVHGLHVIAILLVAVHVFAPSGETAEKPKGKAQGETFGPSKEEPIIITSDRMEVNRKKSTITYEGHVVAVRGDVTMTSEILTAIYDMGMERLKEVVAEGKVRVTQGDRVATGAKAAFDTQNNTVTLIGNPVVQQGKNRVSGSRMIMFINENRGVVEGGSQRVKAIIFPEGLERLDKR